MWKTVICLRAATDFSPQQGCGKFKSFQQGVWKDFWILLFPQLFFPQSTDPVDKILRMKTQIKNRSKIFQFRDHLGEYGGISAVGQATTLQFLKSVLQ